MDATQNTNHVFINCPFDEEYEPLFYAIVFSIHACGFVARCALESQDSSQFRLEKIYKMIAECRYGIHDISRTELDEQNNLPRFNMPLELGIFLGAKRFGTAEDQKKNCIIVDKCQYRYQKFISDIAGLDIESHNDSCERIIEVVRNWLNTISRRKHLPNGQEIYEKYSEFLENLPAIAQGYNLDHLKFNYTDYNLMIVEWLKRYGRYPPSRGTVPAWKIGVAVRKFFNEKEKKDSSAKPDTNTSSQPTDKLESKKGDRKQSLCNTNEN